MITALANPDKPSPRPAPQYNINGIVEIEQDNFRFIGRIVAIHWYKSPRRKGNWSYKLDQIDNWYSEKYIVRELWKGLDVEY